MNKLTKKAGEKYLSIWWFFVLTIIAGGIVIGVIINTSTPADVRSIEADILVSRVVDCIINNGKINNLFLSGFKLEDCYLSEQIIDKSEKYYLGLELYSLDSCKKFIEEGKLDCDNSKKIVNYEFGVSSFKSDCSVAKYTEGRYYPGCMESYIYVLAGEEKKVLHVLAASNQQGKKEAGV